MLANDYSIGEAWRSRKRMIEIGLTGMIATGKSLALSILREEGVIGIDADRLWKGLLRKGEPGYCRVITTFGKRILDQRGHINKKRLRREVLESPQKLRLLEKISHPLIFCAYQKWLLNKRRTGKKHWAVCLEAALLLEKRWRVRFKKILVMKSPQRLQMERLRKRKVPPAIARALIREHHQRYGRILVPQKTIAVVNGSSRLALKRRLRTVLQRIKKEAE